MQPHYFQTPQGDPGPRRELTVALAGRELTLHTVAGVFSGDRVDLGTRVLLRSVPPPPDEPGANLLDLGCGWGPVAITQALLAPASVVWGIDVNDHALQLTTENAALAGVSVRAVRPEQVPDDVRFAAIWSNPPIRVGKAALHELLLTWLPRLAPGAQGHLVVQRNLGADSLHAWLIEQLGEQVGAGWRVERAGSAKGYRVLRVTAPSAS